MKHRTLTRRDFLLGSATAGAGALLSACSTSTPEVVYEILKETVVVEEVVKETVVVERVVEKIVEVDSRRAEMTLGYTPFDQEGTFNHMTFGWGADLSPAVQAEFEEWFAEWYPNMKYERSVANWDEYWAALPALIEAGDHPDVAKMHFLRTAQYACQGWMLPIDDYVDDLPPPDWPDDYHQVAADNMAYRGVQYGLAWDWAPRVVLINRDIMEEVGMPYPVPDNWTWDEVMEYAIAATKETPRGRQFGLVADTSALRQWNMVRAWGGRFFNEDVTESRFNDPKTIDSFQWIWESIHKHRVVPSDADLVEYDGDFWPVFEEGRIGMLSTLSDETRHTLEAVGDVFRVGIGPDPVGPSGQRYGFEGNCGWFIPSRSNWPDIAYELMRWRLTDDDQVIRWALTSDWAGFPARKSAGRWNVVTVEEKLPEYGHAAWELGAENQEHFPLLPEFDEWRQLYRKWIWPLLGEGDPDVEGALLGLHQDTNDLFAQREPCAEPGTG